MSLIYTEQILLNELQWEYNLSPDVAQGIIQSYKQEHKYEDLCQSIEHRDSISTRRIADVRKLLHTTRI